MIIKGWTLNIGVIIKNKKKRDRWFFFYEDDDVDRRTHTCVSPRNPYDSFPPGESYLSRGKREI